MAEIGDMDLYSVEELADKLNLAERTVRKLLREGEIKGRKLGKRWYVSGEWLREYFSDTEAEYQDSDKEEVS